MKESPGLSWVPPLVLLVVGGGEGAKGLSLAKGLE